MEEAVITAGDGHRLAVTSFRPVEAPMAPYRSARSDQMLVSPREHGIARVGHFGYFRQPSLWPLALDRLAVRAEATT